MTTTTVSSGHTPQKFFSFQQPPQLCVAPGNHTFLRCKPQEGGAGGPAPDDRMEGRGSGTPSPGSHHRDVSGVVCLTPLTPTWWERGIEVVGHA